jgi:hypothetical protein
VQDRFVGSSEEDLDPHLKTITFALWTVAFKRPNPRIYEQVTLTALHRVRAVLTARFSSHPGALDLPWEPTTPALISGIVLLGHPQSTAQSGVYLFPSTIYALSLEVMVDDSPAF